MFACSSMIEDLIAAGIMIIGIPVCFILAGRFADNLISRRHPVPSSDQACQSGCFIGIILTAALWLGVCFPLMRVILRIVCGMPFGFN